MRVKFVAVQERDSWRLVRNHTTLSKAIYGSRGAENLLRNLGAQRDMVRRYGHAHAVLVWDEEDTHAHALRLKVGTDTEIDHAKVPLEELAAFKRKVGPSTVQIEEWFARHPAEVADFDSRVYSDPQASSSELRARTPREYRYGAKSTWEVVLDAVRQIGRPVTSQEVGDHIMARIPDFARTNLGPDLSVLSVNCRSRANHSVNSKPRRTDSGNKYDRLIRMGTGRGVLFELYEPTVHGVWELADVGDKKLRPRYIGNAADLELEIARESESVGAFFDPSEDARRRTMVCIVQREGQPAFRRDLLAAYGGACAISGCKVESLLEAAHVIPYRGAHTNDVQNGLLLRADLHKLFDLHLIGVDPKSRRLKLSSQLSGSEYAHYEGAELRQPTNSEMSVHSDALEHHMRRCGWMNASPDGTPLDK